MLPNTTSNNHVAPPRPVMPPAPPPKPEAKEDFGNMVRRIMYSNSGKFNKIDGASPTPEEQNVFGVENHDWDYYKEEAELSAQYGNRAKAETMWNAALEVAERFSGKDPRLAYTLDNVASLYFASGKLDKAEMYCKRALSLTEDIYGKMHLKTAHCMNNLAGVYYGQRRFGDAEALCVQVLTTYNKLLGPDHKDVGMAANNLGMLYHAQGKYSLAELLYERALPIRKKELGKLDPIVVSLAENYVSVLECNGRGRKAEQIRTELKGSGIWRTFDTRVPLTVPA